jgi:flagellar M-ring protein FliF
MEQLKKLLASLSLKQKISIGVAAALVLFGLYEFSSWRKTSNFKPLYTGVSPEEAGAIVQKIKESGVDYRLSQTGGVISVPSEKVAELRIELAAAGLPKSGRIGFELFDKSTFGSTEYVEHINYERALEGELERSVSSLAAIQESRVHLTFRKDSLFVESQEPAKASVVVKLKPGAVLTQPNVLAVQQMIASAVEGLSPDSVSIVDTRGQLLSKKPLSPEEEEADRSLTRKHTIERGLLEKINLSLEPLMGRDKYRAGVTVEIDNTHSEQEEETYDPTKSVMSTSQKTEEEVSNASTGGIPGTASNLPRPPARAGGTGSSTVRRTENVTYATSHIVKKTVMPQGSIKKLSVSVLLDQPVRWEGKGSQAKPIYTPPTPETLKSVNDVIAGLVGYDKDRGDQITVASLPFDSTAELTRPPAPPPSAPAAPQKPSQNWRSNPKLLIVAGAAAAAVVLVGVIAALFLRRRKKKKAAAEAAAQATIAEANSALALQSAEDKIKAALAERQEEQDQAELSAIAALKLPPVKTKKAEVLLKQLRETAEKDPMVQAQVLQTWIRDDES